MAKSNKPPRRNRNLNQWPNIPQGKAFMDHAYEELQAGYDPSKGQPLFWFKSKHSDHVSVCHVPQAWLWFVLDNLRGIGSHKGERLKFGMRLFCPQRMKMVDAVWPWHEAKTAFNELNNVFGMYQAEDERFGLIGVQTQFIVDCIAKLFDTNGIEEY
jgi:hypothetical protein